MDLIGACHEKILSKLEIQYKERYTTIEILKNIYENYVCVTVRFQYRYDKVSITTLVSIAFRYIDLLKVV